MARIGSRVTARVAGLLRQGNAVNGQLAEMAEAVGIAAPVVAPEQVVEFNAAAEASVPERFPTVAVFCEKLTNSQIEKGRRFSGKARVCLECRTSQDRFEGLDARSRLLADAVTEVLWSSRGDWGEGFFYGGGYEVQFGPVKRGGKHFLQTVKISLDVDVSTN